MSALRFIGRLLSKLPAALDAIDAVGKRLSRRPPPPPPAPPPSDAPDPLIDIPSASPIYQDEHCFSREAQSEPPPYCYYCKQLKSRASRYCPGYPPKGLE